MNRTDQVKKHLAEYKRHMDEGQYPRANALLEKTAPGDIKFLLARIAGLEKKLSRENGETDENIKILRRLSKRIKNAAASNVVEMEVAMSIDKILSENAALREKLEAREAQEQGKE